MRTIQITYGHRMRMRVRQSTLTALTMDLEIPVNTPTPHYVRMCKALLRICIASYYYGIY